MISPAPENWTICLLWAIFCILLTTFVRLPGNRQQLRQSSIRQLAPWLQQPFRQWWFIDTQLQHRCVPHSLSLNYVYKHTYTPLQAPTDQKPVSWGLGRDLLSEGVIKKVSDVKNLRRFNLSRLFGSARTLSVWSPHYPVLSFPMAVVSLHTSECQNSELI